MGWRTENYGFAKPFFGLCLLTLFWANVVLGQPVLEAVDLRLPIGGRLRFESIFLPGPLAQIGLDVGPVGADRRFDLTASHGGLVSFLERVGLTRGEAPFPQAISRADYVLSERVETTGGAAPSQVFIFVERNALGDMVLARARAQDAEPVAVETTALPPLPIIFGAEWNDLDQPVVLVLTPGVELAGRLNTANRVDAWGQVATPAGEFAVLRLHQVGSGRFTYPGLEEAGEAGQLDARVETFTWLAAGLGAVGQIQEVQLDPLDPARAPMTVSRFERLVELTVPTAVTQRTWGQVKRGPQRLPW
ncbi:MAG: hypothetical protein GKR89_13635 [Candidatus Latescibacteria bacterium]|nr:hypothetical protein [Candidatus Latescibacterota bacterium]